MALLMIATGPVLAQAPADDEQQREQDAALAQVLRDPGNAQLNARYAEIARRGGDYEAAIGALERNVFNNPNDAATRTELGILYFRLGSYDLARVYFESAGNSPDATAGTDAVGAAFLDEIERRLQTTRVSFTGMTGLRFQSNANAGPGGPFLRAGGIDTLLTRQYAGKPDWSRYVGGGLRYVHDFENQRGDLFEAQVSGYYSRQFHLTGLDAGILDFSAGPRLAIAPDALPGWSIKPYLAATGVTLGAVPYAANPGAGVSLAIPVETVLIEPGYEFRQRRFFNSLRNPSADEQTGRYHIGSVNLSGRLSADVRWTLRFSHARADTRRKDQSYSSDALDFGLSYEFQAFAQLKGRWTLAPYIGVTDTAYDVPDVRIDPRARRKDHEWRVGARLDAPLWENVGFGAVMQYSRTGSSIPNNRMHNFSVSFGPNLKF